MEDNLNAKNLNSIKNELTLCYEGIGRKAPESLSFVAASILDAVPFRNTHHIREVFRRAKDIEPIPSQKVLKECWKNYGEEFLKYENDGNGAKAIGYTDRRGPWLPKEPVRQKINEQLASQRYCISLGQKSNDAYNLSHETRSEARGESKTVVYVNPSKAYAFDKEISEYIIDTLYPRYWRSLPQNAGYPSNCELSIALSPPTVDQFRDMLKSEGVLK